MRFNSFASECPPIKRCVEFLAPIVEYVMKIFDRGFQLIVFSLFVILFTFTVVYDLYSGEILRGVGHGATMTLAKNATHFYVAICFFFVMALNFWVKAI